MQSSSRSTGDHRQIVVLMNMAVTCLVLVFGFLVTPGQSFVPPAAPASRNRCNRLATAQVRRLYYTSASDYLDQLALVETMRASEIRKELESYGVSTRSFFEKSELVQALKKARAERAEYSDSNANRGAVDETSSAYGRSTSDSTAGNTSSSYSREEQIKRKIEKYKSLSLSELKKRLENQGISTQAFLEKSEFIVALAEARAYDPEYRDVNAQKFDHDPYDPNLKGLIDIGPDGKASTAPPPRDRYGRDEYGYNGYGREEKVWVGEEERWEGRDERWATTTNAHAAGGAHSTATSGSRANTAPTPPPPPPPDEYQKRYEAGSAKGYSNGQVPFSERHGRNSNGVDSGWWDQPYEARRRGR